MNPVYYNDLGFDPPFIKNEPAFLSGDLNQDGTVNIHDLFIVAKAFGSHGPDIPNPGDPPSENWNAIADLDGNKEINIRDLYEVAKDYGKTGLI